MHRMQRCVRPIVTDASVVCACVNLFDTAVRPMQKMTVEPIDWTLMGSRKNVSSGRPDPPGEQTFFVGVRGKSAACNVALCQNSLTTLLYSALLYRNTFRPPSLHAHVPSFNNVNLQPSTKCHHHYPRPGGKRLCNGRVSVRLSVCLSRRSTGAATCGRFAAAARARAADVAHYSCWRRVLAIDRHLSSAAGVVMLWSEEDRRSTQTCWVH